jgi:hypothetical protein
VDAQQEIESEGMDVYELVRAQQQAIEELTLMLLELRRTVNSQQTNPSER